MKKEMCCKSFNKSIMLCKKNCVKKFLKKGYNPNSIVTLPSHYNTDIINKKYKVSLLILAVITENINSLKILLRYGVNPDEFIDDHGFNALHHACCSHNYKIISILLKNKAYVNFKSGCGSTPLQLCCDMLYIMDEEGTGRAKQKKCMKLLIKNGADIYTNYRLKNNQIEK